ncbi:Membrane associated serine protease, rhomboid family [Chitinophaga terrae (ex Kim and Jung 2007)]|jgi:membrane associated rhomboid family serine protease|uniref:Membrane associated serine protease, rhomboid family n=1 Tax=Chitinophaga terrae (ex Kim and Jung 2007) TaxID=408074 RepID=A0A1H4GHS6_9BACT|nr:rhomboid family intramembrane serine protease [Chitinophaga terrae (ex Kim and Jung 2007)]MDQ0105555.1 membrane associated rhomboid family serine protease [Chitinophaga terrae (ex Kim and Jung 2007)]GEP93487.1 rhomboid family intramembrane serine protease [Chitinophaga terrae (ex Kim and Jung 2007)]SEB09169.1 Membrane associated serine protease, rhomboid family [Chitinophaga terrae (ex Kim and Jung 2007)]
MQALDKEKSHLSLGEGRNMVTQLIVVNLTIFIFLFFTLVIYQIEQVGEPRFYQDIVTWLRVPADPNMLLKKPWTLITAMFTHLKVLDIFTNMIWLWCFGSLLQQVAGYKRILPLYLFGGICGFLTFVIGTQVFPAFHNSEPVTGAAGSIMAIAIGVTYFAPKYKVFPRLGGGIPVWVITLVYAILSLGTLYTSKHASHIPELVGAGLAGLVYMWQWKKGRDLGAGFNNALFKVSHAFHPADAKETADAWHSNFTSSGHSDSRLPYRRIGKVPEQKLNEILDKINSYGLSSLSPEEKDTLLRASKTE